MTLHEANITYNADTKMKTGSRPTHNQAKDAQSSNATCKQTTVSLTVLYAVLRNVQRFSFYNASQDAVGDGTLRPPVPPRGELDETYASSFIMAHSLHCMKT